MPDPVVLKATSAKKDGTYSVKGISGNELFIISTDEESGAGIVYDNKNNPVLKMYIE